MAPDVVGSPVEMTLLQNEWLRAVDELRVGSPVEMTLLQNIEVTAY